MVFIALFGVDGVSRCDLLDIFSLVDTCVYMLMNVFYTQMSNLNEFMNRDKTCCKRCF